MKLLTAQISSASYLLTAASSKSSPQHPVIEGALSVFFPYYDMSRFTSTQKKSKTNFHVTWISFAMIYDITTSNMTGKSLCNSSVILRHKKKY